MHKGKDLGGKPGASVSSNFNTEILHNVSSPTLQRNDIEQRKSISSQSGLTPPNENLEVQLKYLTDQLSDFEQNLEVYDEMLKNMEVTSVTSESESEVN